MTQQCQHRYLWAYNGYLHGWAEEGCPQYPGVVSYVNTSESQMCTANSVKLRHLSHTTDLWDTDHPAAGMNGTAFEEKMLTDKVVAIIEEHDQAHGPLFLYYAMHLLHSPLCVPPNYLAKFDFITDNEDRKYVAAMINYLDDVVGRVEDTLKAAGLWNNTLMVWSSDNGAAIELGTGAKSAYPLKGGYYTNWEGGIRTAGFVNGGIVPDVVRGTVTDGYIHLADWYVALM